MPEMGSLLQLLFTVAMLLFLQGTNAYTHTEVVEVRNPNDRLIQTIEDELGAENFTYYRLHRTGSLRLELKSLLGDVDIYISTEYQHPSYDKYDLKSETCGVEIINIPSTMPRPVYIAVFGHPNKLFHKFSLKIWEVEEDLEDDYEAFVRKYERYYYDEPDSDKSDQAGRSDQTGQQGTRGHKNDHGEEEESSVWVKFAFEFLRFVIEIIL